MIKSLVVTAWGAQILEETKRQKRQEKAADG